MFPDSRTIALAALTGMLLGGLSIPSSCAGDRSGRVQLRDASDGCGGSPERLELPVAVGAELAVEAFVDGEAGPEAAEVTVADPAVFEVVTVANPFHLRALSAGVSAVALVTEDGRQAARTLSAAPVAAAAITPSELTVWPFDAGLGAPFPEGVAPLLAPGIAVAPGGTLALRVTLFADDGRELLGFGAADWRVEPPGAMALTHPNPLSDDVALVAQPQAAGSVAVTTAGGGRFDFSVLAGEPASATVYLPELGVTGDALSLGAGETRVAVLVLQDADGRVIVGEPGAAFAATLPPSASPVAELVEPPWAAPEGGLVLDESAREALRVGRVVHVRGLRAGATTLTLAAGGQRADVAITVR